VGKTYVILTSPTKVLVHAWPEQRNLFKLPFNYKAYVHYVVVVENQLLIKMKQL